MNGEIDTTLGRVADYYSNRLAEFGETSRGVDWNGPESQTLRFEQLSKVFNRESSFSVNDLGCGYGALYEYLANHFDGITYVGYDISSAMVDAARNRYQSQSVVFIQSPRPDRIADYGLASGIFNVRLSCPDMDWFSYVEETLDVLDRTSARGFAFNCLTSYSDLDRMRDYLYYADPCRVFDLCKRKYSKNVALLHDYRLYEFTVLVRKFT